MKKVILTLFATLQCINAIATPVLLKKTGDIDLSNLLHHQYFMQVRDPIAGRINYTNNGQFILDKYEYVSQNGKRLQVYPTPSSLTSSSCQLSDLHVNQELAPTPSTEVYFRLNLDATTQPITSTFTPSDVRTFTYQVGDTRIYDKLGQEHTLELFFVKTTPNRWNVYPFVDSNAIQPTGEVSFDEFGLLHSAENLTSITYNTNLNPGSTETVQLLLSDLTQFASPSIVHEHEANGHPMAYLNSFNVDKIGNFRANYTGGIQVSLGKIAVFSNPETQS